MSKTQSPKRRKSDIPAEAEERFPSEYRQEGNLIYFQRSECILNDQVVGIRSYDLDGNLMVETPLKNGKKHGREYTWNEDGSLESVEPYFEGKLHGLSKQYGRNGKIIGTYRCVHGTGFDIWRCEREDGSIMICEIHSLQDGRPHGFEWWVRGDQRSVWHERHWHHGIVHGIERMWNKGKLQPGYPKFWIQGRSVRKATYLKAAKEDKTLPGFREKDNRPQRQFPLDIENLFSK